MGTPDHDLVSQAVAGDQDALSALLEAAAPAVRQALRGAIPRRWQSVLSDDDVMQQTYVDAFRDIGSFVPQGDGAFAAWLRTLARRNLLDAIRMLEADKRGGGRRPIQGDARGATPGGSYAALFERLAATITSPSACVARADAGSVLRDAIATLPGDYRTVVEMYDLDEQPVEDVAAALERSAGAVYMLRSRAHRMLSDVIGSIP